MKPKTLLVDIETSPMLVYAWDLWDQNIGLNQIHTDWSIISCAAKWLGESVVYCKSLRTVSPKKLLKDVWVLLNDADLIITQNGKRFDAKKLNAQFIQHGMKPTSSYQHIDTLQLAKKHFGFTSNKLAYMTDKLCKKYKKLEHKKYPGFELWRECLKGNVSAWREMEKYNKYDVLSLEELYTKLIPWDKGVNLDVYHDELLNVCSCGKQANNVKNGYFYSNVGKYARYKCTKCGKETRSKKNMLDKEKKESLSR